MQFVKLMWSRIIGMIVKIPPVLPSDVTKKLPNAIPISVMLARTVFPCGLEVVYNALIILLDRRRWLVSHCHTRF